VDVVVVRATLVFAYSGGGRGQVFDISGRRHETSGDVGTAQVGVRAC